jgi:hypothetical protein
MNSSLHNKKLMLLALLGLNLLGWVSPSMAAINCGDTIGPNESVVLTTDLQCSDSPALILQGPNARLDMDDHELSCTRILEPRASLQTGQISAAVNFAP